LLEKPILIRVEELLLVSSCLDPKQHLPTILPPITPLLKKVINVIGSP
jgi:hypothetical protein